jgi:chemotaxis protein methyltransferase CheR
MSDLGLSVVTDGELGVTETEQLLEYIKSKTGIVFAPRLHGIVKKQFDIVRKLSNSGEKEIFLRALITGAKRMESQALFENLTIHETMFFRDVKYFNFMETFMIPQLIEANKNRKALNIWVAAGSSGQEVYSILFMLYEKFPELKTWALNLYSTDLSKQIVQKAKEGIYESHEVNRGLPESYLKQYFKQIDNRYWQVKDEYRQKVTFKASNLVEDFSADVPTVDFISCRNVLIYFNDETKKSIVQRLSKKVCLKGFLLLGQVDYINSKVPSDDFEYKIEGSFPCYRRTK